MSEKTDKFEEIFEQVLQLSIKDVIESFCDIEFRPVGGCYMANSPFRVNGSSTSFSISEDKNLFKDWVLPDCVGNSIRFVSLYCNLNYFEACMQIALKYKIISEDFYEKETKRKCPKDIIKYEKKYNTTVKEESNIADEFTLNKVFKIFISCCKLSESHKRHIMEERKLSEDEIKKYMLFTFPSRGILRNFLKKIVEEFGSEDVLSTIPGFYRRVGELHYTFMRYTGIGIPIQNENGNIVGIQIRKDELKNSTDNRYAWFSSSFALGDGKENENGTSSGSPIAVIFPEKIKYKSIFITEGFWKAVEISKEFNCIALSVQGVSTWKPIKKVIEAIPLKVDIPNFEIKRIYPAFDADMCRNINVYLQLKKMTDSIIKNEKNSSIEYICEYICWDMELGKGIDDMLINGHKKDILNIPKDIYDNKYNELIEYIIQNEEGIENLSHISTKMTKDDFEKYFDEFFDLKDFTKR